MLPLLLDFEKCFGIAGRLGLFHSGERPLELIGSVSQQCLERTLVRHRNNPALDTATKQLVLELLPFCVVQLPAPGLGFNIRNEFPQRPEFDEAVESERDRMTILHHHRRRCDNRLQENVFCRQWCAHGNNQGNEYAKCPAGLLAESVNHFSWKRFHSGREEVLPRGILEPRWASPATEMSDEAVAVLAKVLRLLYLTSLAASFRTLAQRSRCASAMRWRAFLLKTRFAFLSLFPPASPSASSAFPTWPISLSSLEYSDRREVTTLFRLVIHYPLRGTRLTWKD